jgi:NADPH2:quinone reductase
MPTHHAIARRVARVTTAGGPDTIEIVEETQAPLAAGDVRVRVEAVGLNHVESLARSGTYAVRMPFPYDAGIEGAGIVVDAAPDAALAAGTRVCWTAIPGSCGTFLTAPAARLARLPDRLTFDDGASLAHAALTAAGLVRHWPLPAGSTAVVWGAAGAVGLALVAHLRARGVIVIGMASGDRVTRVTGAGAAHAVDRRAANVSEAVRGFTDGRGVDAVFDPIGAATYTTSLSLLAPRGCLVNYGQLSGELPPVDLHELMKAGSCFVTKYGPRAGVMTMAEIPQVIEETLALATSHAIVSDVAGRFPLDQTADAYRAMDAGAPGKILVRPHDYSWRSATIGSTRMARLAGT